MPTTTNKTSQMFAIIDGSRWKKIVIASDNHGEKICPATEQVLFDFIGYWKPHLRVHLGDFMDLNALRLGASRDECADSMREDIKVGVEFLVKFRPDVLTEGNHDWRLKRELNSKDPIRREWCEDRLKEILQALKPIKTQVFGWGVKKGVYTIAGQKMLHGYANGAMSATRTSGQKFGACVHGHNHSADIMYLDTYDGQGRFAQSCPSMCDNDNMDYQLGQAAAFKHVSGFALGLADMKKNTYYCGNVVKTVSGFAVMEPKVI